MVGIYKITNPNNKVYIGQSINIEKRFSGYKNYNCKAQPKLYNSFNKYKVENHLFEIIEQCEIEELNTKERYYQEKYDAIDKGLNCIYTKTDDRSGGISETEKEFRIFKKKIEEITLKEKRNNLKKNGIHKFDDKKIRYLLICDDWLPEDIYTYKFCKNNSYFKCKYGIFLVYKIDYFENNQIVILSERIARWNNKEDEFFDLTKGEIQPIC